MLKKRWNRDIACSAKGLASITKNKVKLGILGLLPHIPISRNDKI